jgi:hypothetical protein
MLEKAFLQANQIIISASATTVVATGSADLANDQMNAIVLDYVVWNFTQEDMRVGTFRTTAIGTINNYVYDETSTVDIGNTSGVIFYSNIVNIAGIETLEVIAENADAYDYTLQYFIREFKA